MRLTGKRIVLGVTGGIAAYKAVEVLRHLMQEGAEVRVVMSAAATRFVTPLTFRALSGFPVLTALYDGETEGDGHADESGVEHIELVKDADLLVVAPATANTLAKAAHGLADDALTTVLAAAGANVLWAPAMNHRMWHNAANRANLEVLRDRGHATVGPDEGWMACREYGLGRMAEPGLIVARVVERIGREQDLAGARVLVSAGRTEEDLDPVRVLTNRSSGRTGVAVAAEALARGATVTLVAGPMDVAPPEGAEVVRVRTAAEMDAACREAFPASDVLVMAAAVGDFRAAGPVDRKIKRTGEGLTLELASNPDILAGLGATRRGDQVLVGFALETDDPEAAGREKLVRKGLDLIVVNRPETGIGGETNTVTLLDAGGAEALPELGKDEVARRLLDRVVELRAREGDHVRPEA